MNARLPSSAVVAEDVSKVFFSGQDPVWALEDFSLTLDPGSFTCIVGPSGCGKSTFLRILGGLEERTVGTVTMPDEGQRIPAAFVFQEHGVFPWMTVLDNIGFGLRMSGIGKAERTGIARDWLSRVRLDDFADAYPHQLSGGMRQRVAIARAFATGSPLLLMDEPLGALDAQTRMLMQEELIALWEQERKTILMVTHDIDEAIILSDRVIVMSGRPGTLREDITVPFDRPRSFDIERSPEFSELRSRIWNLLREDARTAEETA
ncbi:ABC transporter ATP-binding protein [Brachybacterium sp. AOP35-5H-19]|uniref:ABC transporter ATP-binding protein n=1 Tax=Brachybacterium sp. AOP35-5H-19 TaxID=3457685 RepID=UPI0040340B41